MPNYRLDLRDSISKELGKFIASKSSTFACGGTVPVRLTFKSSSRLLKFGGHPKTERAL